MGKTGRTPTTGQKQLMGINDKSYQSMQYKKTIDVHSKQQQQQREKKENKETESEGEKYE